MEVDVMGDEFTNKEIVKMMIDFNKHANTV
jgi:hypothetical protein